MHGRRAVGSASKLREPALHQIDHLRIELDGINRAGSMINCLQHIATGSRAKDEHARAFQQVIRQRGSEVIQVRERLAPPVVARECIESLAVGEYSQLRWRLDRCIEAQPRRVPKRH